MGSSRKTKKKKKNRNADPTRLRRLAGFCFRPRLLVAAAIVVTCVTAGPQFRSFLPQPDIFPQYRVRAANVVINEPPHWVPHNLVRQVFELAELPDDLSLLDDELNLRLVAAFSRHPWVRRVTRVEKSWPAKVTVELTWREPAGMVQFGEGVYPIDPEGVLLPPHDFTAADIRSFPLIQNVRSVPDGPAGTPWGDEVIRGAARLAEQLAKKTGRGSTHWQQLKLKAIEVPDRVSVNDTLNGMVFVLITDGGSRIIWGRAPGANHPGELTVDQKLDRLTRYVADFGDFDGPGGPYEIDIRHWQEISRRPVSRLSVRGTGAR